MKRTLQRIFNKYPNVEEKFKDPNTVLKTTTENVFYDLALFFDQPEQSIFNLNSIHSYLKDEELIFAIQLITSFFSQDTDLIKDKRNLYLPDEEIYNQTQFGKYLAENGLKYNPIKVGTYYRRKTGKIPQADLIISNTPYWFGSTVDLFMREEKEKEKEKAKQEQEKFQKDTKGKTKQ
uniref:Uncharacterized protein n=1 Tax=Aeromonas sp. Ne-1 TaxID=1675689 RepID=A0A0H4JBY3_9GAMM|nr:hypothetical protein [Aeromonas sp. Ne-1]AKO69689.1 hypothetical protein [Aeromonas sp. Ne-1]